MIINNIAAIVSDLAAIMRDLVEMTNLAALLPNHSAPLSTP
jgi:hypothetical protein